MSKRLIAFIACIVILFSFAIPTYAETTPTDDLETESENVVPEHLQDFYNKISLWEPYEIYETYTFDSVRTQGVSLEPWVDTFTQTAGFTIVTNLDYGIVIYDDPNTDIIDGIRVNGNPVKSLKNAFDLDNPTDVCVEVRLVYASGIVGDFAKLSDGNYEFSELFENPLALFQIGYYALAALTLLISGFAALASKKKKVKTADDIATKVDERADEATKKVVAQCETILDTAIKPILSDIVTSTQAIVKALTLTTSKSKEAPVALLDVLHDVANTNVDKIINDAKHSVEDSIKRSEEHRKIVSDALTNIANNTYQEVPHVAEESHPEQTEEKSVF